MENFVHIKPKQLAYLPEYLGLGLMLLVNLFFLFYIGIIINISVGLYLFFYIKTKDFYITDQRIIIEEGVFNRTRVFNELFRYKDNKTFQPFYMRIFGLGNLILYTSHSSYDMKRMELKGIEDVNFYSDMVRQRGKAHQAKPTEIHLSSFDKRF